MESQDNPVTRTSDAWRIFALSICIAAFAWMEWAALRSQMLGRWYLADVGSLHYCLVNTLHGRFMWSPMVEANHFGYHFTPLLLLMSPVTWFSAYPVPLVSLY